jgi:hypothetical protein
MGSRCYFCRVGLMPKAIVSQSHFVDVAFSAAGARHQSVTARATPIRSRSVSMPDALRSLRSPVYTSSTGGRKEQRHGA